MCIRDRGDIEKIKKAECELNRQMRDEMYISLNDFYYEIGLDNIKPVSYTHLDQ